MSEDWGYYCEQCSVESDTWFNHGETKLREVYAAWPHVRAIREMGGWMEVSILGGYDGDIWAFLEAHDGHPLTLHSEYGYLEPLNPQDVTRGFIVRFTVTGTERQRAQAAHKLDYLPDGGQVRRIYEGFLQEHLHKRIQYDYELAGLDKPRTITVTGYTKRRIRAIIRG